MTGELSTALIVDDEKSLADLYATWLEGKHDVRIAYSGAEALDAADEEVDIVFLDRQMPDLSGDDVLERLRDRGLDCRVVMVTAVDPDFDIVDMDFDDYLTKPITREDLEDAIETMREREGYSETLREYFALAAKKATLEAEMTPVELEGTEEYRELVERVDRLEAEADAAAADLSGNYDSVFQEFPGGE